MSIRIRFMIQMGVLSLFAIIGLAVASYNFSINNAVAEAKSKGQLVLDYLQSSRLFFKDHQRPKIFELAGRDRFIPELMSGFVLTRGIWDEFQKRNSDFHFKQATIDPLYPPNKADSSELAIINAFEADKSKKVAEGTIKKNDENFYYFAQAITITPGCLRCHGDPATAPREQIEIYGTTNGYNWKENEIVAAYIVYVPLQKAMDQAMKSAINLVLIGTAAIVVIMLTLWFSFSRYIVNPVTMLEKRATEISLGKNLGEAVATPSQDEIGSLARAVDRLRISVKLMLNRLQKK